MPDMPQGGPPPAAGGAQPPQAQGGQGGAPGQGGPGGGIGEAIISVDQTLNKITQAVSQNSQLPPEVKSGFEAALSAFRQASTALVKAAGGGDDEDAKDGGADESQEGGAVTPQQGGSGGAVPMTHQNMRGG